MNQVGCGFPLTESRGSRENKPSGGGRGVQSRRWEGQVESAPTLEFSLRFPVLAEKKDLLWYIGG